MNLLRVRLYGDPILREVCKEVEQLDQNLVLAMRDTAAMRRAWGLSAPQIGHALCLFIVKVRIPDQPFALPGMRKSEVFTRPLEGGEWKKNEDAIYCVIANPTNVVCSESQSIGHDACESLPRLRGLTMRPDEVEFESSALSWKFTGNAARAAHHELDHLGGVLWIDRLKHQNPNGYAAIKRDLDRRERIEARKSR